MDDHTRARWNHNIHYHSLVLDAVPPHARSALDVGTGNGVLATDLRAVLPDITAIDLDAAVLAEARTADPSIDWILGDVMTHRFGRRFDVVASVAAVHHLPDLSATLRRLADLTAPSGVLVVIGLAARTRLRDYAFAAVGTVQHRWYARRLGYWEHTAPLVWPPPHSFEQVDRCAASILPGVRWRHLPMFRYALVWHKPADDT